MSGQGEGDGLGERDVTFLATLGRKLRNEGLVRGIHGIGTEVLDRPAPMSSGAQRQDRGRRTGSSWGTGERSDSHQASVVPAPAEVAQALDLKPGSNVIRRSRVYR